jgi:hypothetical protein
MHEHMSVQKNYFILGHPLTAKLSPWLSELKGQRWAGGGLKTEIIRSPNEGARL